MRPSVEEFSIIFSESASSRSEDLYKKVGCSIFNKEGRLLSIGYNGFQSKQKVSKRILKDREERRKYIIHAEINALSCLTRYDNPYLLACTLLPCSSCAINIASYGIKKVIYKEEYEKDKLAKQIFKFYNIDLIKYET